VVRETRAGQQQLQVDQPWFAMPLAASNLREHFRNSSPGDDRLWAIRHVAEGLSHAHANGVLHRDLKPENVLIFFDPKQKPRAALSDFGLGRRITRESPSLTETGMRMGTVEYMAPEQYADSKHVDVRADVYGIGKILYEALTGLVPYPHLELSRVPADFRYVVQRACAQDPGGRHQQVADLLADLNLVTVGAESMKSPLSVVRALAKDMTAGKEQADVLAKALMDNLDDTEVLTKVLPEMPVQILRRLFSAEGPAMLEVIKRYDESVSGGLPFDYCDTVANFYENVLAATNRVEVRVLILRRLPQMGFGHNRFHVGDVLARIIAALTDKNDLLAMRDVLREHPDAAAWCQTYLKDTSLPPLLTSVLVGPSSTF